MKKFAIITAILLLAVTAFAQRGQDHKREASERRRVNDPKSSVTTQRNPVQHKKSTARKERTDQRTDQRSVHRETTVPARSRTGKAHPRNGRSFETTSKSREPNKSRAASKRIPERSGNVKQVHRTGTRSENQGRYRSGEVHNTGRRAGVRNEEYRRSYTTPNRQHARRKHSVSHTPVKYKAVHYHYREPGHVKVFWTHSMYREYVRLYPDFHYWYYPTGYRISTIPAYKAYFHIGEVRNVYGRIHDVWYSWSTDQYYLYFGGSYPYQDFTVILSGNHAGQFHRHPAAFFSGRYIWVTGLLSTFEGRPEIMVMKKHQVHLC